MEALLESLSDAIAAFVRFVLTLPTLPRRLREARRADRAATERQRAEDLADRQQEQARRALVGRQAVVVRPLRRYGIVQVDGDAHEAVSDIGFVEVGATVKIVAVDGRLLRVRSEREGAGRHDATGV